MTRAERSAGNPATRFVINKKAAPVGAASQD